MNHILSQSSSAFTKNVPEIFAVKQRAMNNSNFLIKIGKNIRTIRSAKNISQADLAQLCGIDKASLSRIESGQINITVLTLRRISVGLQVSIDRILSNTE